MEEPFREPSEIVPRVDAKSAMDKLEAAEPASFLFHLATTPFGLYAASDGAMVSLPELRTIAEKLGFTYFGRFAFVTTFFTRLPREIWVDAPSGTVLLTFRRGLATGLIEKQMARYTLQTLFDDGSSRLRPSSAIGRIQMRLIFFGGLAVLIFALIRRFG
ncbi:MAG: hypothetical protein ABI183_13330 [Polyangiaceae bacterium]